ncbi:fimbrial biogenesis chaperone [Acinetobacter ihumii]|uniref:fimbrial biogenesis chaperone n=1 Tax=Acinetobacter ihumii TaxID=2483802 RepID=UPI001030F84F|nr:molecular chaperone [Acinetobacter ihumii]
MKRHLVLMTFISIACSLPVQAGILAQKTRLVFTEGQREGSLMLANTNDYAVVLQTWVDQGEGNPDRPAIPFMTLPPISKMAAHGIQSLRVIYNGQRLPKDRESVYWLNLYEIPAVQQPTQKDAYLSLAMNTQLKVFYRPKQLKNIDLNDIAKQLTFSLHSQAGQWIVVCDNPTPYHASMIQLQLSNSQQSIQANSETDMMSYPKSQRQYVFNGTLAQAAKYQLHFSLIDDLGNQHDFQKDIVLIQP